MYNSSFEHSAIVFDDDHYFVMIPCWGVSFVSTILIGEELFFCFLNFFFKSLFHDDRSFVKSSYSSRRLGQLIRCHPPMTSYHRVDGKFIRAEPSNKAKVLHSGLIAMKLTEAKELCEAAWRKDRCTLSGWYNEARYSRVGSSISLQYHPRTVLLSCVPVYIELFGAK